MHDSVLAWDGPVQDSWPELTCYGCGPASEGGLHLHSYVGDDGETLVATVTPDGVFTSGTPNVLYGGHVASLVDCHAIWTAITFAYADEGRPLDSDPQIGYVTATLSVNYHAPTPLDREVTLTAWREWVDGRKTHVLVEVGPEGEDPTATGEVLAIRVDPPVDPRHHGTAHVDTA